MRVMNILGMSDQARSKLIERANRQRASGDDRLARQLVLDTARQFAVLMRHHADEVLTALATMRQALVARHVKSDSLHEKQCPDSEMGIAPSRLARRRCDN